MSRKSKKTQAKGLVPRLRFPEFQNDGEWEEKLLSAIASPVKNRSKKSNNIVLTLSSEFGVISQREYFGKKIAGENTARYLEVMENDFIYNDRVTTLYPYGTIKRLSKYKSGIVSPIYKCFRFNKTELPVFWEYYFSSNLHNAQLRSLINEGARAGRFNISIEKFLTTSVYYKKSHQQKIADCLTSLDKLIAAQSQKIDQLKGHKKGLMQKLFPAEGEKVPHLRFPEFQATGEWEGNTLSTNTTKIGSGVTPKGGNKNYIAGGRPFIRSQNIGWGELILDNIVFISEKIHALFSSTEIENDDILLNITGASIGRSALADMRICGGNVNQHVCIIRTKREQLVPKFANQYLISQYGQKQIDNFQAGGNRQGLNFFQIRSLIIPLPLQVKEQQNIADCLTSLDELIAAHTNKLELLKAQKKGLMQGLFPQV